MNNLKISISPWKVTRFLVAVSIILSVLSVIGQFTVYFLPDFPLRDGLTEELNVTSEGNFPTLYSTLTLFFCASLLGVISYVKASEQDPYSFHWKALSFIFIYLGLDEGLSLHEHIMEPLRKMGFSGFLYNAWVVPATFILIFLGFAFFRFILHLPKKIRRLFIVSGFIYIFGAFGLEFVEGAYGYAHGLENFNYQLIVSIEELLEILGIIVFIHTLLSYLNRLKVSSFGLEFHLETER